VTSDPDEKDATDLKFWCKHHRESSKWLAIRVHQLLVEGNEAVRPIILASLPEFLREYAHPSKVCFPPAPEES
jgi:hypothetical protein